MKSRMPRSSRGVVRRDAVLALCVLMLALVTASAAEARGHGITRAELPVPKNLNFGVLKDTAADPQGDTLGGGGVQIDIESFSVDAVGSDLVIGLTFFNAISPPDSGEANALDGFIDIDTDQVASPDDLAPWVDVLTTATTGMGDEYYVELFTYSAVDGLVDLVDVETLSAIRVPMAVTGNSITVTIPLADLGNDDGAVNAAAVVSPEFETPSDKVPNLGNVSSVGGGGNPNTVLLQGGRYTVDVEWTDFDNVSGPGKLVTQADDSAVLYFFSPDNWEMLIKVLDGCDINNRWWVFFAATTDVAFTVTVTDTLNNETRTYDNTLGQPADAVTDTDAFATCP